MLLAEGAEGTLLISWVHLHISWVAARVLILQGTLLGTKEKKDKGLIYFL